MNYVKDPNKFKSSEIESRNRIIISADQKNKYQSSVITTDMFWFYWNVDYMISYLYKLIILNICI